MPAVSAMNNAYSTSTGSRENGHPPPRIATVSCQYTRQRQMEITCPLNSKNMTELIQLEDTATLGAQCTLINYDYSHNDLSRHFENVFINGTQDHNGKGIFDMNGIGLDKRMNETINSNHQYIRNSNGKVSTNELLTEYNPTKSYSLDNVSPNDDNQLCEFDIEIPSITLPEELPYLKVTSKLSNGYTDDLGCFCTPQNTLGVLLNANRPGEYKIDVTKDNVLVQGSPFSVFLEEDIFVKSSKKNENHAIVGKCCTINFEIPILDLTKDIDELKAILLTPEGERTHLECTCAPRNTLNITVIPQQTGKHIISILKSGRHIKGSPFPLMVQAETPNTMSNDTKTVNSNSNETDDLKTKTASSSNRTYEICFDIPGINISRDLTRLKASLTRNDSNITEALRCSCGPSNKLLLTFEIENTGTVSIDVTKDGNPVKGSPFTLMINDGNVINSEIDQSKIKLNDEYKEFIDEQYSTSVSSTEETDRNDNIFRATLTEKTTGESRQLQNENPINTTSPTFTLPTSIETGHYYLDATQNEVSIEGSPFLILVDEKDRELSISESSMDDYVNISLREAFETSPQIINGTLSWQSEENVDPVKCTFKCDDNFSLSYNPNDDKNHVFEIKNKGCPQRGCLMENNKKGTKRQREMNNSKRRGLYSTDVYNMKIALPDTSFPLELSIMEQSLYVHSGRGNFLTSTRRVDLDLEPDCSGIFSFYITKEGKSVIGSPFTVSIKEI